MIAFWDVPPKMSGRNLQTFRRCLLPRTSERRSTLCPYDGDSYHLSNVGKRPSDYKQKILQVSHRHTRRRGKSRAHHSLPCLQKPALCCVISRLHPFYTITPHLYKLSCNITHPSTLRSPESFLLFRFPNLM
jgi:hypothetical protein